MSSRARPTGRTRNSKSESLRKARIKRRWRAAWREPAGLLRPAFGPHQGDNAPPLACSLIFWFWILDLHAVGLTSFDPPCTGRLETCPTLDVRVGRNPVIVAQPTGH